MCVFFWLCFLNSLYIQCVLQKRHDLDMTFLNQRLHGEMTSFLVEAWLRHDLAPACILSSRTADNWFCTFKLRASGLTCFVWASQGCTILCRYYCMCPNMSIPQRPVESRCSSVFATRLPGFQGVGILIEFPSGWRHVDRNQQGKTSTRKMSMCFQPFGDFVIYLKVHDSLHRKNNTLWLLSD